MDLMTTTELVPTARLVGTTMVIEVQGEIDLHNSPDLRTEILHLLNKHKPKSLVLNLAKVPYMDSSAAAVLVEAIRIIRPKGGKIYLAGLQPRVKGLLEVARLGTIFTIVKDEAEALSK